IERYGLAYFHDAITSALFCSGDRDAAPVPQALLTSFATELDDTALGGYRYQPRNTHFHRLLDDPVHLVAAGNPLHQRGGYRQFDFRVDVAAEVRPRPFAFDFQRGGEVPAAA